MKIVIIGDGKVGHKLTILQKNYPKKITMWF